MLILVAVPFSYLSRHAQVPDELSVWPAQLVYLLAPVAFLLAGGLVAANQPRNAYGCIWRTRPSR